MNNWSTFTVTATGGTTGITTGDPWKHRSSGMRCKTCMFFVDKVRGEGSNSPIGRCRRHSPAMNGYPVVYLDDWCGDHKVDENKI
jgi:hypothetical protein